MSEVERVLRKAKKAKALKNSTSKEELKVLTEIKDALKETAKNKQELNLKLSAEDRKAIQGREGEKGEPGKDGKPGKDGYTPKKGVDYFDGKDGKDGLPGKNGKSIKGEPGKDGKNGKDGKDGEDGSPDKPEEIRDKLSTLKGRQRLDAKHIKNIDKEIDLRITTSGSSSGGLGTDEKVAVDAEDEAGYLEDKLEAGTNVSFTEVAGKKIRINATAGGGGTVNSVVAGTDIAVDSTDPANPIVSFNGTIPTDVSDLTDTTGVIPDELSDLGGDLDDIADGDDYVKSANDFTDTLKSKLDGIEEGAEVNAIESIVAGDNIDVDVTDSENPVVSLEDDIEVNSLKLDNTPTDVPDEVGVISWNTTDRTADLNVGGGVTLQLNQEQVTLATATEDILNGELVYIDGADSDKPTVSLAQANESTTSSGTIAVATEDIDLGEMGMVTRSGYVRGLDTSGYLEGEEVFLSPTVAGGLVDTAPEAPHYVVSAGHVTSVSDTDGVVLVDIQRIAGARKINTHRLNDNASYSRVQDYIDQTGSAGWVEGGDFTDNGDGTMTVSTGSGLIRESNDSNGKLVWFDWAENDALEPAEDITSYISVDYNSGTPIARIDSSNVANGQTIFNLGMVFREGTELHFFRAGQTLNESTRKILERFNAEGMIQLVRGGTVAETSTRYLTVTGATLFGGFTKYLTDAIDTSGTDTFEYYYTDGIGGWQYVSETATQINNTQYDNGGTLTTLSNNKYRTDWIYLSNDGDLLVVLGTNNDLLSEAQSVTPPASLPPHISNFATLIAKCIVQKNATNLYEVDNLETTTFSSSGTIIHNETTEKQGGTTDEYYHLTSAEHTVVGNTSGTNTGDVTVTDSSEIDFTLTGQDITASIKNGSIDETKLDTSVNSSLDLADSAVQTETDPVYSASQASNITSSDITNLGNLSGTNTGDQNDHGSLDGLSDDDHPQYVKDSEYTTDGGILVATGAGTFAEETGATLRTSIDVDQAGTDNSTDVTLAGTPDYITISGQEITRNSIDLTTDVTGELPTANVANTSGTNTGDQDISGIATNAGDIDNIEAKTDFISVTQAVNLDTMESDIATNNAKVTNADHTGEVSGSGALTIADNVVDEANLKVSNAPTNDYVLTADSAVTGGMKWAEGGGGSGSGDAVAIEITQNSHGFSDGDAVYFNGTSWALAKSDVSTTAGTHIVGDSDTNTFKAYQGGKLAITSHGLGSAGDWLYVSDATAGALTTTEPDISNPLVQVIDANTLHVHNFRANTAGEAGGGGTDLTNIVDGRLTLETGVPVSTTDQTAKTTLYFTPYVGNQITLYDGSSAWETIDFTEVSLSLSGYTAGSVYDIWGYNDGGTLTLESTIWTNTTTRATALTRQDGVLVKTGATTRRYLGTICTTSTTGQCEDSVTKRYVWNLYNPVTRNLFKSVSDTHTYASGTKRRFADDVDAKIDLVVGLPRAMVMTVGGICKAGSDGGNAYIGASANDTTTYALDLSIGYFLNNNNQYASGAGSGTKMFDEGYNFIYSIESGSTGASFTQTQIKGSFEG